MHDIKDMYNAFKSVSDKHPMTESVEAYTHRPVYNGNNPLTEARTYNDNRTHYFNTNRFIDPYTSRYFGSSLTAVTACEDQSLVPVNDLRIDPNKIFNADIQAMKSLAAEQYKLTKLFEKKFTEVLNDKGKYGLTEDDIAAMQALTAAKTAIGNYTKEIVNIKKVSTELKIKAQQASKEQAYGSGNVQSSSSGNPGDIAKNLLDNIFDAAKDMSNISYDGYSAPERDPDSMSDILPNVDNNIINESKGVVTKARVGSTDKDVQFVSYDRDGNVMPDVTGLTASDVKDVDRDARTVTTNMNVVYSFDSIPFGVDE